MGVVFKNTRVYCRFSFDRGMHGTRRCSMRRFPNLERSVRGIRVETVAPEIEDEDASYAGAPFTETAHDEEWMTGSELG